jgi:hypothetical protein
MAQRSHLVAALAATAMAATPAASVAGPPPPAHVAYGCRFARIWRTPGHHPVGLISLRERFYVTRYSPSRRWALGTSGPPGSRLRTHGWVRHRDLCRRRPHADATR